MDNTSFEAEPVWKQEHIATSDNWCGWYYTQRQKGRSSLPFHLSTKACDIWGTEKQTSNPCIFPPNMVSTIIYGHWIASEHDFLDQWILDLCFLLFSYVFRSFFEDVSFEKTPSAILLWDLIASLRRQCNFSQSFTVGEKSHVKGKSTRRSRLTMLDLLDKLGTEMIKKKLHHKSTFV